MARHKESDEGTPFHMALNFYLQLTTDIISPMDHAIREDNLDQWFRCLDALSLKISFRMNRKEATEIREKLNKVENWFEYMSTDPFIRFKIRRMLREVNTELIRIMDRNQMIFPKIDSLDAFDKIRRKLQLHGKKEA